MSWTCPAVDYEPDGFDQRVKTVRQELKKERRAAEPARW